MSMARRLAITCSLAASRGTPNARSSEPSVLSLIDAELVALAWSLRLAAGNEANTGAHASWRAMNEPIHPVRCTSPGLSGVTVSSCLARVTSSAPSSVARAQNTSSFDEKYW
jgi:hypothetical protein